MIFDIVAQRELRGMFETEDFIQDLFFLFGPAPLPLLSRELFVHLHAVLDRLRSEGQITH